MTWNIIEEKKNSGTGLTSVGVTFDSAPSSGEALYIEVFSQANSAVFTPPTGFQLCNLEQTGAARTVATYVKIADGTEGASFSVSADSSAAMGIIAKRISHTDGVGSISLLVLNAPGTQYSTSVTSLATPDCPAPAGAFVIGTAYSNGTLSSLSGGFGTPTTTTTANGGVLVSATKTSAGAVEKLTQNLTAGNTRQVVTLTVLLPATLQGLKRALINIAGASSGVSTDGKYYNALAMSSLASVSNLRNSADSANTGWGAATTNVVAQSSTGNSWGGDYFSQAVMQTFARLDRTADNVGQLTITGLDNSKTYGFVFAGLIGTASDYTVVTIGAEEKQFLAAGNPPGVRYAGFVAVPSSGSIVVDVTMPASGSQYAALGAIELMEFPGTSSAPVISSGTPTGTTTATPTLGFTTDTNSGTARVVLSTVEADLDAVTGAQVLAGQDETGAAADAATGVLTVSTTTPTGTLGSALPTGTYYAAAAQLKDGQYSNVLRWSFTVPPNPGLRLELRDTDTGALQGPLTNVDFAVRFVNQSEASLIKSTTATTDASGILVIDSDALGNVGDTVWISGKHSSGRTFARDVLVVDLNDPSSMSD